MPNEVTWPMVALALIAAAPGLIAAIVGVRNGQKADAAKEAAAVAAGHAREAKAAAEESQRQIVATKDGIFRIGERVDGRVSELVEEIRKAEYAGGKAAGVEEERTRSKPAPVAIPAGVPVVEAPVIVVAAEPVAEEGLT